MSNKALILIAVNNDVIFTTDQVSIKFELAKYAERENENLSLYMHTKLST